MPGLLREGQLCLRSLGKKPLFSLSIAATLALGIGATTAMVTAYDELLVERLPYPDADRLVALHETGPEGTQLGIALANLLGWRAENDSFLSIGAGRLRSFMMHRPGAGPERPVIQVGLVTADYLGTFAVVPRLGRLFDERAEIDASHEIVVTAGLWRRHLRADPDILGTTLLINDEPYTVIGVMPDGFEVPMRGGVAEAFTPLVRAEWGGSRSHRVLEAVGRLRPGRTIDGARAELARLAARDAEKPGFGAGLQSLQEALAGGARSSLQLLLGAAALLLLIACCNVAHLLLADHVRRERELAIRAALGAT